MEENVYYWQPLRITTIDTKYFEKLINFPEVTDHLWSENKRPVISNIALERKQTNLHKIIHKEPINRQLFCWKPLCQMTNFLKANFLKINLVNDLFSKLSGIKIKFGSAIVSTSTKIHGKLPLSQVRHLLEWQTSQTWPRLVFKCLPPSRAYVFYWEEKETDTHTNWLAWLLKPVRFPVCYIRSSVVWLQSQ